MCHIRVLKYRAHAIITCSRFETTLDYKARIFHPKIVEFSCLVHKLSVTLKSSQNKNGPNDIIAATFVFVVILQLVAEIKTPKMVQL